MTWCLHIPQHKHCYTLHRRRCILDRIWISKNKTLCILLYSQPQSRRNEPYTRCYRYSHLLHIQDHILLRSNTHAAQCSHVWYILSQTQGSTQIFGHFQDSNGHDDTDVHISFSLQDSIPHDRTAAQTACSFHTMHRNPAAQRNKEHGCKNSSPNVAFAYSSATHRYSSSWSMQYNPSGQGVSSQPPPTVHWMDKHNTKAAMRKSQRFMAE